MVHYLKRLKIYGLDVDTNQFRQEIVKALSTVPSFTNLEISIIYSYAYDLVPMWEF